MWAFSKPVRWGGELERAVFMGRTLALDWLGYGKLDFLEKMPATWGGCVVEDLGLRVTIRNPGRFNYFEFDVLFDPDGDMIAEMLVVRGRLDLEALAILFKTDGAACCVRSANNGEVLQDAKRAAAVLARKYHIPEIKPPAT